MVPWFSLFGWPMEAGVFWAVWEHVLRFKFGVPELSYWECMFILALVGTLFPSSWTLYLKLIASWKEAR